LTAAADPGVRDTNTRADPRRARRRYARRTTTARKIAEKKKLVKVLQARAGRRQWDNRQV